MAKRDDSVKKKVPELRFKGFTDDWEERKFSDIVVRLNKSSNNNQLPKVEFEDIIAGEGRLNKDISRKFDDRKGTLFEPDNILYGKLRPYLKNWLFSDFKGIALGDFWVFKSINSEPKFVYSLIQADNYQRVANDTSGTKMPRSDWKKVSSSNFSIPTSLEEQQKIGSFFKQLDDTIALHQRKLDLLKEQKKGFLQKMFPKNGEKVPELRFAGFADNWEQRKFEEIWKRTSDKNKDLRFKPTDILSVAKMKYSDSPKNSTDEYMKTYFILKKGDIAFEGNKSKDYSFGRFVLNDVADGIVSHVFITFEPIAPMDINFMKIYINNEEVMKHKLVKSTTKTLMMTTLNVKDINRQMLPIPNLEEQQKIGTFFKSLDNTIALHQRKLDLLKEQKKGFLQKMFV